MALYIKSVAHHTPEGRLTNADLEKMVDTNDEWIVSRTGISERAMAKEGEGAADLALPAAREAMKKAGVEGKDLDAIVVATCTPDTTIPGASSHVQKAVGAGGSMAFDLNAACSGFVYAMEVCEGLLATGRHKTILLVCAEKFSSVVNYKDRNTCILFGDGAGALVLSSEPGGAKLCAAYSGGDGELIELLWRPGGGSKRPLHQGVEPGDEFLQMKGKEVFKHAVRGMATSAETTLERAGWSKEDLAWLIPHQANKRLIQAASDRLKLDQEQVVVNIEKYGNMSAASIPVAMSEAQHKFKDGDKVVCLAFGAGFTWGGLALEWETSSPS
jgi:3-oxoacyl-[acyl-carrier-protein] synthase III